MTKTNSTSSILRPMQPRDPHEHHRAATPLELLYDLVLVIAVGAAAAGLHHAMNEDHVGSGVFLFLFTFWTLWWPWVNFTWFASAYDNDDALYRVLVFIQMIGALMTAVGVRDLSAGALTVLPLAGYIVMRVGMIALWLRAAASDPAGRTCALRYATGIALAQVLWIALFVLAPREYFYVGALLLVVLEMFIPVYAEKAHLTPWHRHHIVERYGLLVIIVFGESLFSAATAIAEIARDHAWDPSLWAALICGFVILFAMWWIYFGERYHSSLNTFNGAFSWGYGHYFVFASAAAAGGGIAVLVDQITHHSEIERGLANAAIAVPAAAYLLAIWWVHDCAPGGNSHARWQLPVFAALILLTPMVSAGFVLTALLILICLVLRIRDDAKAA